MKKAIVGYPAAPLRGSQFRAFGGSGRKISDFSGRRQYGNTMRDLRVSPSRSISAEVFAFFQELAFLMAPIKKTSVFCSAACARRGLCEGGTFAGFPFAFHQRRGFRLLPRACVPHGTNKKAFPFFCPAACARRGLCEGGTFAGSPFAFHQRRGFRLLPRSLRSPWHQ